MSACTRQERSWGAWAGRLLLLVLGAGLGCKPHLPEFPAQQVRIQVHFTSFHSGVTVSISGAVEVEADVPAGAPGVHHVEDGPTPGTNWVPTQFQERRLTGLVAAEWKFTVTVRGDDGFAIDRECRVNLVLLEVIESRVVKIVEGVPGCVVITEPDAVAMVRNATVSTPTIVPAPPVTQGDLRAVRVQVGNAGNIPEMYRLTVTDAPGACGTPVPAAGAVALGEFEVSSADLHPAGATRSYDFDWTASASGARRLIAAVDLWPDGSSTADVQSCVDVAVLAPPVRDIWVNSVSVPGGEVLRGALSRNVAIGLQNLGCVPESVSVTLTDTPPGGSAANVGSPSAPVTVGADCASCGIPLTDARCSTPRTATVYLPWTPGNVQGDHVLTASVPQVSSSDPPGNNSLPVTIPVIVHDVQAVAVTALASADIANALQITVQIRNNGNVGETVPIILTATSPIGEALIVPTLPIPVGPGATVSPQFNWQKNCRAAGLWSLSARTQLPGDMDTTNDAVPVASTVNFQPNPALRQVNIALAGIPPSPVSSGGHTPKAVVSAGNSNGAVETVDVRFDGVGPSGNLAGFPKNQTFGIPCGETRELSGSWLVPPSGASGSYTFTGTITTPGIPGNSPATVTVTVP